MCMLYIQFVHKLTQAHINILSENEASAIKRQQEPMYQRALQFLWTCDHLGNYTVYQECKSDILLHSEFRTVILAIKFRRVKPIKAYSTSFDSYLCAHGI